MRYGENESRQNHVDVLSRNDVNTANGTSIFHARSGFSRFHDIDVIWIKAHFTTGRPTLRLYISLIRNGREK